MRDAVAEEGSDSMPLIIQNVLPRSLAARHGIKSGEKLLTINGQPIRDFIDLQFYSSESILTCEVEDAAAQTRLVQIVRTENTALGIEPEAYKHAYCCNHCVFCYVDQMPQALRNTLYEKDDDYLYSFVFGNYVTLTNLTEQQFRRIIRQKLSPIYVSVHTTNPELRQRMMLYRQGFDVLERLKKLSKGGIQIHAQIVLVPEWNDGAELERTLDDLLNPKLRVESIGIVPVGLTRYRSNLPELRNLTPAEAQTVIDLTDTLRRDRDRDCLYVSDEIYIKAGIPVPQPDYYNDFPQLENGIGLIRLMLEHWDSKKRKFLHEVRKKAKPLLFVTGVSAYGYICYITQYITAKAEACPARVIPVINNFMGQSITVTGLLTWQDIKAQVNPQGDEIIVLSGSIFNRDGITLDGFSQLDIKEHWDRDILIVDPLFSDWEWI